MLILLSYTPLNIQILNPNKNILISFKIKKILFNLFIDHDLKLIHI